jgi:hypothetical protein
VCQDFLFARDGGGHAFKEQFAEASALIEIHLGEFENGLVYPRLQWTDAPFSFKMEARGLRRRGICSSRRS